MSFGPLLPFSCCCCYQADNADIVFRAMEGVKDTQITAVVASLSTTALDNLMKYIYLGLSFPRSNGTFLKWHEKCFKKAGSGSIMRVISTKERVY